MGWVSFSVDSRVSVVRFWNTLIYILYTYVTLINKDYINMKPDRLPKLICVWGYQLNNNNWSSRIETIRNTSHNIVDLNLKRLKPTMLEKYSVNNLLLSGSKIC